MAVRASIATGNFLTAGTWGLVDATSYLNSETGSDILTTAYSGTRSQPFTPGAITVSHIGVKLSVRTGTTGTISVHLALNATHVEVAGTAVTLNVADLPVAATADLNGGWVFFKLATPILLLAATAYELEATTSSASQVSLFRDGTTDNISRALITTTTGAPGAGDDLIVSGEYTGAGTSNSFVVTMDETATTDYGAASTSLVTPAIAICSKGTLGYGTTAATNYLLKVSGNVIVYSGGELDLGTTGTKIPRDSTAKLNFDCGANVDFGLTVRNLGTFVAQGLSRTSGKDIVSCKLNTDEAANSTSLGVDTDTGWLDNDLIAVASTTRTNTQCEQGALNGNAGASSLTVDGFAGTGGGVLNAHSGTSPTQAEVILLTRNVSIYGASITLQAYVDIKATAIIDVDWTEFYWMGSNTSNKNGLTIATTTGSFDMQYSSLHDFGVAGSTGPNISSASGSNIVFSNNVTYNIAGNHLINVASTGVQVFDTNIFMRSTGIMVSLADVGCTFKNITIVGSGNEAIRFTESALIGNWSNIISHSNAGIGFGSSGSPFGSISTVSSWRNNSTGFNLSSVDLTISNLTGFGNLTTNITAGAIGRIILIDPIISGDSSFATTNGMTTTGVSEFFIYNGDFGTATGIKVAHTNDISVTANSYPRITLINTKLASTVEVLTPSNMRGNAFISSQKHDQTAGLHKTWKRYGIITIETSTVHTGSHSVKLTPNDASNKLESPSFYVAVANGATVTPLVYVYEDASYNGARARLIVKRNDALGITADTVLDTATASSDAAWEGLTGTTASVTDDGVLEFVVDCDGTAGNLFMDSFSA